MILIQLPKDEYIKNMLGALAVLLCLSGKHNSVQFFEELPNKQRESIKRIPLLAELKNRIKPTNKT